MRVAVEGEDAVRSAVIDDRVGVLGRGDPAQTLSFWVCMKVYTLYV
jgi:hypothetical protein